MKHLITFGTDGIRGRANQYPFTASALQKFGKALGLWAIKKYAKPTPQLLLASDTRESCPRIKQAVWAGLEQAGISVIDAGVIPTPAVFQLINHDQAFDCGLMISASHNPHYDNGLKIFDARACKLTKLDEQDIVDNFMAMSEPEELPADVQERAVWAGAGAEYGKLMATFFPENFLAGTTIVLDCAHGATYQLAPMIFESFGANVVVLNVSPNGTNINNNCGALHPENLQAAVVAHKAHAGFAFDGDGDRVIAVNRLGEVKDGDDALSLLLRLPRYALSKHVVGTVMTNSGFEQSINQAGVELIRTSVGDKYVSAKMEECDILLGGETSGHIIVKDYSRTGDGIFVALKILESMLSTQNWDMVSTEKYPQVLVNVPVQRKHDLTDQPFAQIIAKHEQELQKGRILVRYSGTENLLRVMTEAPTNDRALSVAQSLAANLQQALSNEENIYENC
ncbi:hypothetical protein K2W90_05340 [Candidatus Babeliales bacterium]|nr:hypothetical protein [Candidatus Babeliales bacterium]